MSWSLVSGFDWDDGNRVKCQSHGLTLGEVEAVFRGRPLVTPDIAHSLSETRFIAVGRPSPEGRAVFVAFTTRQVGEETRIRPISARFMHATEIAEYEKALPRPSN